jgi:hypothetical protein
LLLIGIVYKKGYETNQNKNKILKLQKEKKDNGKTKVKI